MISILHNSLYSVHGRLQFIINVTKTTKFAVLSIKVQFRDFQVKDRLKRYGNLHPLNIFLKQEIDRMQRVIFTVRITLTDLKLAIDGTIIMSEV